MNQTSLTAQPNRRIYLLRKLAIVRPNQVWAADISYIPMAKGFVYLVAIVDWFGRRVLSWRVSITMEADFCVEALEWKPTADRGVRVRQVGIFPHRGLTITGWKIEQSRTLAFEAADALHFLFVMQGNGSIDGEGLRRWSAVRVLPGEEARVTATDTIEAMAFGVSAIAELTTRVGLYGPRVTADKNCMQS